MSEIENTISRSHSSVWKVRLWRYIPLVFWLGFIFFASTGEMSASNTSRFIRPVLLWLFPNISEPSLELIHVVIRKCAHFFEYALLALLAARAFTSSSKNFLRNHWFLSSLLLVIIYALLDEYHQTFVSSRMGSIYDSMIDTTGGLTALVVYFLWKKWRDKKRTDS